MINTSAVEALDLSVWPIFSRMSQLGIRVDSGKLETLRDDVMAELGTQRALLEAYAGEEIGTHSQAVSGWLEKHPELLPERPKRTPGGKLATGEKVLVQMDHPALDTVLVCRGMEKLLGTFICPTLEKAAISDGIIHPRWRLTKVRSGRPSMEDPNLLAFPSRDAWGKKVRGCFVARPGRLLVGCDFSQIEPRLAAALSGDPSLIRVYAEELDLYEDVARRIFRLGSEQAVDKALQRTPAKVTTLGILYGLGDLGLYDQLLLNGCGTPSKPNFDVEACGTLRQAWFDAYPGVTELIAHTVERARCMGGVVVTTMGRPRYLPALLLGGRRYPASKLRAEAERQGFNHLIQGTAAEEMKKAMVRVERSGLPADPLLQIYDEMVYEVPERDSEVLADVIEACMTAQFEGAAGVTLKASATVGSTWEVLK